MREHASRGLMAFVALTVLTASALSGQAGPGGASSPPAVAEPAPATGQQPVDLLWRTSAADPRRLFSVVGLRLGTDQDGDVTRAGQGRVFAPLGARSAVQIGGTYDWYHDRHEGQINIGLVNRVGDVQLGLFSSGRHISVEGVDAGRWLSQVTVAADYVFATGRVGAFATAPLRDTSVLGRRLAHLHDYEETVLRLVGQVGASWRVDVARRLEFDGHLALLSPEGRDRTGGLAAPDPCQGDDKRWGALSV